VSFIGLRLAGVICGTLLTGVLLGYVGAKSSLAEVHSLTRLLVLLITIKMLCFGFGGSIAIAYVPDAGDGGDRVSRCCQGSRDPGTQSDPIAAIARIQGTYAIAMLPPNPKHSILIVISRTSRRVSECTSARLLLAPTYPSSTPVRSVPQITPSHEVPIKLTELRD